jgi:hypothetical protein
MMRLASLCLLAGIALACGSVSPPTAAPTTPAATPSPTASPTPLLGTHELSGAEFTESGGCGDVFMWATTPDGTLGITIQWNEAASAAWEAGDFSETAQLPDAAIEVALVAGRGLSKRNCTDILMPGIGEDSRAQAEAGTVEMTVRPDEGGFEPAAHADVTLRDIVFTVNFGTEEETWRLDELVLENVSVGWFAG